MISLPQLIAAKPALDAVDPTILGDLIVRAQAFIETQTRRYFGPPLIITDYLSGNGSRHLRLSEPVTAVDSEDDVLAVEERCYPGADATLIGSDGFALRSGGNTDYLVRLGGCHWKADYEYAVSYPRGYEVDGGPKDIEALLIELIALRQKYAGKEGMRSELIGGYSYTKFGEGDLDSIDGARATLNAWKRRVLV